MQCYNLCCSTGNAEDAVLASSDGLTLAVSFELFPVPVLHRMTNGIYVLGYGHAEKLCESMDVVFLSATAPELFSDEEISSRRYPCV